MPTYLPRLRQAADGHGEQALDGLVALVEMLRHDGGVAIQPERELGQVVGADRHAVEVLEIFVRQQRVGRQLAHHDDLEAVLAAAEAVRGQ